jgi:DNA ligase-associated metallophosphoesterase
MKTLPINFGGQAFELCPDCALWWPSERTLIVADIHIGKAATFRAFGIPVPSGTTARNLARLTALIERFDPQRLLILGDLLHARESHAASDQMLAWRQIRPEMTVALVRGNHDRKSGALADELRVDACCGPLVERGIAFVHEPVDEPDQPTIAGHVHPSTRLTDFDGSTVKVPCFVVDPQQMILPSFGTFTGGYTVDPAPDRRSFAVAAGRVIEVTPKRTRT